MANNKSKIDRLHDQLPKYLRSKVNPNWKVLLEAIGQEDERLVELIQEVKKQFFVQTASRPYIDRLGANFKIDRPRFIGMDDVTFRRYVPVLAYQPKQVKLIIDMMLDLFFFRESTTSFSETTAIAPYNLSNNDDLLYEIDGYRSDRIVFQESDFVDISNATAHEIVNAINRQAQHSFAVVFSNRATKEDTIRLFTNTVGSKGSVEIKGGTANIYLRFEGFIDAAGTANNTEWTATKIGHTMTFEYTGGNNPGIDNLRQGDIIISKLPDNEGSFVISHVDISKNTISFNNIFGTVGVFTQTSSDDVKFIRPKKSLVYKEDRRAVTWETEPGKLTIEMPTSPPVVRRTLEGSAHINGFVSIMTSRVSDNSIELDDTTNWPDSGTFILEERNEIKTKIITPYENTIVSRPVRTRFQGRHKKYHYEGINNNVLMNITPELPQQADINLFNIYTCVRESNVMTISTVSENNYKKGEHAIVHGTSQSSPAINLNGTFEIIEIVSPHQFKVWSVGEDAIADMLGNVRVERVGLTNSGSRTILTQSVSADITRIWGPYIWDLEASFLLSARTGVINEEVRAGQIKRILELGNNNIPSTAGEVIFDFGTENQEGPVRFLYKPSENSIALDPAYIFQHDHDINSSITMINRRGAHVMSGTGREIAPYITDTAVAREILQELILTVKSVGIFVDFLVRFPEQLYAVLDVYRKEVD